MVTLVQESSQAMIAQAMGGNTQHFQAAEQAMRATLESDYQQGLVAVVHAQQEQQQQQECGAMAQQYRMELLHAEEAMKAKHHETAVSLHVAQSEFQASRDIISADQNKQAEQTQSKVRMMAAQYEEKLLETKWNQVSQQRCVEELADRLRQQLGVTIAQQARVDEWANKVFEQPHVREAALTEQLHEDHSGVTGMLEQQLVNEQYQAECENEWYYEEADEYYGDEGLVAKLRVELEEAMTKTPSPPPPRPAAPLTSIASNAVVDSVIQSSAQPPSIPISPAVSNTLASPTTTQQVVPKSTSRGPLLSHGGGYTANTLSRALSIDLPAPPPPTITIYPKAAQVDGCVTDVRGPRTTNESVHSFDQAVQPVPTTSLQTFSSQPQNFQLYGQGVDDSSDEDEEEAFLRKRTLCKEMTFPKAPEGVGFRSCYSEALAIMESSSNKSRKRTRKFVKRCEPIEDIALLVEVAKTWEPFDIELLKAIKHIAQPSLTRVIENGRHQLECSGQFMSGRLALRMFVDQYRFDIDRAMELEMKTSWAHKYNGNLALYLDGLDKILFNFNHHPYSKWWQVRQFLNCERPNNWSLHS